MENKTCTHCGEAFPRTPEFFHRSCNTADGLRPDCKPCHRKIVSVGSLKNPDRRKRAGKQSHAALRIEVLTTYSQGEPSCQCCGEHHLEFLTLDHIHEDGAEHRRELNSGKSATGNRTVYRWAKRNGYPPTLQVLCQNCNRAKHICGECPHQRERREAAG